MVGRQLVRLTVVKTNDYRGNHPLPRVLMKWGPGLGSTKNDI